MYMKYGIITDMEEREEPKDSRRCPSTLSVVLWCVVGVALVFQLLMLLVDGEIYMAAWLLIWSALALLALRPLRRKRDILFAWPLLAKIAVTVAGLCGALGMLIQCMNFGVMATYFTETAWWATPASILCLVLTFFLPAVVVLIWLARRD
ncbi:MAG: hypothetical protein Q4F38_01670 [Akkermansia sp.]|nr:hypothetical protein [Akkermansia sp.]